MILSSLCCRLDCYPRHSHEMELSVPTVTRKVTNLCALVQMTLDGVMNPTGRKGQTVAARHRCKLGGGAWSLVDQNFAGLAVKIVFDNEDAVVLRNKLLDL